MSNLVRTYEGADGSACRTRLNPQKWHGGNNLMCTRAEENGELCLRRTLREVREKSRQREKTCVNVRCVCVCDNVTNGCDRSFVVLFNNRKKIERYYSRKTICYTIKCLVWLLIWFRIFSIKTSFKKRRRVCCYSFKHSRTINGNKKQIYSTARNFSRVIPSRIKARLTYCFNERRVRV